ncbi:MAG: DNA-3-methyladenine glycosylase [Spirochaetia bacterium]|nr:DNA-3-methyladenine glycosylase [Spirochaetia bacterium]
MTIRNEKPVDKILPSAFYLQDTLTLAKALLGKHFTRIIHGKKLIGKIVETEAYHEDGDPSCHAHRGKTPRNAVMFGQPGCLYVYFTYGMHHCMNIVSEPEDIAAAVLIRALQPLEGIEVMQKNRGKNISTRQLCSGPAKLCQAFDISKIQNGHSLQSKDIYISSGENINDDDIEVTTRIGISKGIDLPWRFYIKNNPYVSKLKAL